MPTNGDFIQRHAEAVTLKNKVTALHIISDKQAKVSVVITDEIINDVRTLIAYVKFTKNPFLKWFRFIKAFKKVYMKIQPIDVIHVNRIYPLGVFAWYLKYYRNKPFIVSEHWTGFLKKRGASISRLEKWVSKKIVKSATYVCPVSQNLADSMKELGLNGKYKVVPNVVDTNLFVPKINKRDQFTLLHVSNMIDEHKNIHNILKVASELKKRIPDFKFIFIGEDSTKYKEKVAALSLQNTVELLPQIKHADVAAHMQKADVFVLFSNYENLPCVILESFSCGLPVISSNVGGISEFFPSNFGYLVPSQNNNKLLETLIRFYESKTDYNSIHMHEYVRDNFSEAVICDIFSSCYTDALKG